MGDRDEEPNEAIQLPRGERSETKRAGDGAELTGVAERHNLPEAAASCRESDRMAMIARRAIGR